MEEKKYQVLWIDDEYEKLVSIRQKALDSNIVLACFTNAKDGIDELKAKFLWYDAVLLDGLFYRTNQDNGDVTEETALVEVVREIERVKHKKVIPWFVLTGQQKIRVGTGFLTAYDIKPYDKLEEAHIERLFEDIKEAANQYFFTQLQHKYSDAFTIFHKHLNVENKKSLLKILLSLESTDSLFYEEYNKIRQIYEVIFSLLKEKKIISDEINSLNQLKFFISKKNKKFIYHGDILHPLIVELISRNINICNDASHDVETLNLLVNDYSKKYNAKYVFSATVYSLLETLVYLDQFLNEIDTFEFTPKWEKKNLIEGKINRIAENSYATFLSSENKEFTIIPHFVKKLNLEVYQKISIETSADDYSKVIEVFTH